MPFKEDKFKPRAVPQAFYPSAGYGRAGSQSPVERDILPALIGYWQVVLGEDVTVELAFKDERIRTKKTRSFPEALISQLPTLTDSSRQHSVLSSVTETDPGSGICRLISSPVPVILNFQMDIYSPKWRHQRVLNSAVQYVLGSRTKPKIVTEENRGFYIEPAPGGLQNEIEYENDTRLRRSASRFAVRTWLTSLEVHKLYIVLSREFEIESEIMQDAEE